MPLGGPFASAGRRPQAALLSLKGAQGTHVAHPPPRHPGQDRNVATLSQSAQSPFSQEIKKYTTWVASRAGPRQCTRASCLLSRGSSICWGHPGPSKSRVLGAEDLGSLEQQDRGTGGAHVGPAGSPDSWVLWHLGPPRLLPECPRLVWQ